MFGRMIRGTLFRQWKKMLMIAFTIALGASLASAMLSVMLDVGDKVNQELKTYGANIRVLPKSSSVLSGLYEMEGESSGAYLKEDELGKIKTIFWTFNIVDYAPFINVNAHLDSGEDVKVVGSWFNHHMTLPTGEELNAGVESMRSWWELESGVWLDEQQEGDGSKGAMIGTELARKYGLQVGSRLHVTGKTADDSYVTETVEALHKVNPDVLVMIASGVSTAADCYNVVRLGADGTGATSGILNAPDRAVCVQEWAEAIVKAYKERTDK